METTLINNQYGIILLEAEPTIEGQIIARKKELKSCRDAHAIHFDKTGTMDQRLSALIKSHMDALEKLRQLRNADMITLGSLAQKKSRIETIIIEGRSLEVYPRQLTDNPYVVYQNKIWKIVSKEGIGTSHRIGLEREIAKERCSVGRDNMKEIRYILKPTGYISI